jgi:hypothetical protein
LTGRQALGPGLHQGAEHIEPVVLSQGGEGRERIGLFHISAIIELMERRQETFQ